MISSTALKLQQSPLGATLPGCWALAPARAFTLHPEQVGVFRVAQGQVWMTQKGPHHGPANDWGDVVLHVGEEMPLLPGQPVVVESFGDAVNEPAFFSWQPTTTPVTAAPESASLWRDPLAQPLLGPDHWPRMPMVAARRWLSTLVAALPMLVAGRGRVLAGLESNQP